MMPNSIPLFLAQADERFVDKVSSNPLAATFSCLILIPAAILVVSLVHWMVAGEIDFLTGICGLFMTLVMVVFTNRPPADWVSPVIFFGMIGVVIGIPLWRKFVDLKFLTDIDIERLERAYKSLDQHPGEAMRQFAIAKILFDMNLCGHAVGVARIAVANYPKIALTTEEHELRRWEATILNKPQELLNCLSCGTKGEFDKLYCQKCGSPYVLYHFKLPQKNGTSNQVILMWAFMFFAILMIPILVTLGPLPTLLGIPIVLALLAIFATKLFRKKGSTN